MATILIVDDSATSRLLFKAHMPKDRPFQVVEADDLHSALQKGTAHQPDLVFLDYNMPEKNGTDIAHALREAGLDAAFFLLTANTQESVLEAAEAAGIQGILEKPITAEKIQDVLQDSGV
ncbi:MAG TPA: response regulator [Gammaproteobacteria bacterium]|nr:response regulator [Gammaproteobacteria bacterium]